MSKFDHSKYNLERYHKLRIKYLDLLGNVCVDCGSNENLEFDHIDPKTKKFTIGDRLTYPESLVIEELKKCQLLCNSCHKEKNKKDNGESVHGTLTMYSHYKCRCDLCKKKWNEHSKNYRRKRLVSLKEKQSSCKA